MNSSTELLTRRFELNMGRIARLAKLSFSKTDALEPFQALNSEGARADISRAIVVFMHAAFEDSLRTYDRDKGRSYYSGVDFDKALRRASIDAKPFKPLYPPLTQMAKRRKRIVHNADFVDAAQTVMEPWSIVDHWELIMWNLAVLAFFYQLLISKNAANKAAQASYDTLKQATATHVAFGKQLVAFPAVSPELQSEALLRMIRTLNDMKTALKFER